MNNINLIGRLTSEPELRYSKNNTAYCNFSLAVNRDKEQTDFINCTAFNSIAENISKYISKGQLLAISGELRQGSYEKEGKKISYYYVNCHKITFIEKKGQSNKSKNDFMDIPGDLPFN